MSATNQTTNYDLPLFIGTDKPSWLGDFNGAMNAIDTAIKGRADDISALQTRMTATETVANTASSTASTALTNANNAQTSANAAQSTADNAATAASGAQSTANTAVSNAATAQSTANTASSTATSALTTANLANTEINKLNFTEFDVYDNTDMTSQYGSVENTSILTVATNSEGSIGKVYGNIFVSNVGGTDGAFTITIPTTKLRPSSNINITGCSLRSQFTADGLNDVVVNSYSVATNGTITINMYRTTSMTYTNAIMLGCIIFLKDFGDQPVE